MTFQEKYLAKKEKLLSNKKICKYNRKLFKKFFDWEEIKLKRMNQLRELDERCYKTLYHYTFYFVSANKWFKNKPWKKLTKKDIWKVYNDLEDGKIKRGDGEPVVDKQSYYNKVFKSKPFKLAGKKELAEEVIEYSAKKSEEVSYIELEDFKKNVDLVSNPFHKCFLWLCFDIMENHSSILLLKKRDCIRRINKDNKEPEYLVNLRKEILKRSRTPRTEPNNFSETVNILDIVLKDKEDDDLIFSFGERQGEKIWNQCIKKTGTVCIPNGNKPTLRTLRKSGACHLLTIGWETDDIKGRLGHKPSSRVLDAYVTYLALNKNKIKKKVYDNDYREVLDELGKVKQMNVVFSRKFEENDKRWEFLYKLFKMYPEIADQIIIKNPILIEQGFNL